MFSKTSLIFLLSTSVSICVVPFYNPRHHHSKEQPKTSSVDVNTNVNVVNIDINVNAANPMKDETVSMSSDTIYRMKFPLGLSIRHNELFYFKLIFAD